jgi:hypothetical protein
MDVILTVIWFLSAFRMRLKVVPGTGRSKIEALCASLLPQ